MSQLTTSYPHAGQAFPEGKSDAATHPSIINGERGRDALWQWYHGCIRQMVREAGCQPDQVDDLAHDLIINRLGAICQRYDSSKGRFRAYLYGAVVNYCRDHHRRQRLHVPHLDDHPAADRDAGGADLELLSRFFDHVFARFVRRMTMREIGFYLLRDWCLSGRDVEESIAVHRLTIGIESGRKQRARAVACFADFIGNQLDTEDFAAMAADAARAGISFGLECDPVSIAQAFRWPSEEKRLGKVALLLRYLYLKYRRRGVDFDSL